MVKYTHKRDKKHKKDRKHKKYNLIDKNIKIKAFNESFNKNYIFHISILISIFILYKSGKNTKSIINIFLSFILISMHGYFAHYTGHKISFVNWFNTSNTILKEYTITNKIINYIAKIFDFHHNIHHDSDINKKPINIIKEFLNNFIIEGFFPFLLILILRFIDLRVCFVWGLSYASIHNINYLYLMPKTHSDHHKDSNKNIGIDIWDIIFGTKYDWNDIEQVNHYAINFILSSIIVILIYRY